MHYDFSYFFQGTLRKEEVASGFLAMLLAGDEAFRRFFFEKAGMPEPETLATSDWTVDVEVSLSDTDRIDLVVTSDDWALLIENKVKRGAKQSKQLLRYYKQQLGRDSGRKIAALYVAPAGMGADEPEAVRDSKVFRDGDVAAHLAWDELAEYCGECDAELGASLKTAFDAIDTIITSDAELTYPLEGIRVEIVAMADAAKDALEARFPDIGFQCWPLPDGQQILTTGQDVTLWMNLRFAQDPDSGLPSPDVRDDDTFRFRVETQLKLAGKIKATDPRRQAWKRLTAGVTWDAPGWGQHSLGDGGWLRYGEDIVGSAADIEAALVRAAGAVLDALPDLGA